MHDYIESKIADYAIILEWTEKEIEKLDNVNKNHSYLIECLKEKLVDLQSLYKHLQIIATIENTQLYRRAIPIIHIIEYEMRTITYFYIPALHRENTNDLFLRNILLPTASNCGLSWIKDIVVRLDGPHRTLSALTEIPIIYAPPQQCISFLDMAGLYHELGHSVFQRFEEIGDNLTSFVSNFFKEYKQKVGPMSPEKKMERNNVIENAEKYWDVERINELFSDIFASYVCGPAYYFSCIDISIRINKELFQISNTDVHPPWGVRINSCYKALIEVHKNDKIINTIKIFWDTYSNIQQKDPDFDIICPDNFLNQFVDLAIQNIEKLLQDVNRFSDSLENLSLTKEMASLTTLEDILNNRLKIILTEPISYGEWVKNMFKFLKEKSINN